jgi:hypothetical protein
VYFVINPSGVDSNPETTYNVRSYDRQGGKMLREAVVQTHADALDWVEDERLRLAELEAERIAYREAIADATGSPVD